MAELKSPMAGKVQEINIKVGQMITEDDELFIIEAMKMENVLFATRDAVVAKVLATPGESLAVDQPIVEFE